MNLYSCCTQNGAEIDFIVELPKKNTTFAIEVKASRNTEKSDLRSFKHFEETTGSKNVTSIVCSLSNNT